MLLYRWIRCSLNNYSIYFHLLECSGSFSITFWQQEIECTFGLFLVSVAEVSEGVSFLTGTCSASLALSHAIESSVEREHGWLTVRSVALETSVTIANRFYFTETIVGLINCSLFVSFYFSNNFFLKGALFWKLIQWVIYTKISTVKKNWTFHYFSCTTNLAATYLQMTKVSEYH